jgi:multidrug efflux pump subunit AcrA (membrane-fusion protein)
MRSYAAAAPAPVRVPQRPTSQPEVVQPTLKPPRRRGSWWVIGGLLALAAVFAYRFSTSPSQKKNVPTALRSAVVRRGVIQQTIRLSGLTVAQKSATLLTPQMWGSRSHGNDFSQVLTKLVPAGSFVRQGEIVAEFDRLYMLNRMDDYNASVAQHRANVRKLKALLEVKRKSYEQQIRKAKADMDKAILETRRAPVLAAIRVENNRLNVEEAKAKYQQISDEAKFVDISETAAIRAIELDLQRCIVEHDRAQRNVDRMVVEAPMDGMAVMQTIRRGSDTAEIQVGDQLSPGLPYMQIVDLGSMGIEANLNQVDAERVRIGQKARVQFDAYPGLELPAHVTAVTAFARSRGWRGNYVTELPVRLQLDAMDKRVIPNFSVGVELILDQAPESVTVPLESLFRENGKDVAYVRRPAGWEKHELKLGLANNVAAVVLGGLNEGDVVAAELPPHAILATNAVSADRQIGRDLR